MFIKFKNEVENQLDRKVKRIRSDRGGEYGSESLIDFCERNGIIHETSLPDKMWGKVVLFACHILNRVLHKKLDKTSYEIWKGYPPNLSFMKVWGVAYKFMSVSDRTISDARDAEFFEHIFLLNKGITNPFIVPDVPDESCHTNKHASCSTSNLQVDEPLKSKKARVEKTFGDEFITNFLLEIYSYDLLSDELISTYIIEEDLKTYNEALKSIDANFWMEAIKNELDSIVSNQTWELIDLPKGSKPISSKWIFKKKIIPDGTIERFKARLVIRVFGSDCVIICMYVDDMLILENTLDVVNKTKELLSSNFEMKDLGEADVILGVRVIRNSEGISLSQSHYVEKVLKKFNSFDVAHARTPYDPSLHLTKNLGESISQSEYAKIIGSVMFLMNCTRLDIAYDVSRLSRYTHNPSGSHWNALLRLLKYLKGTIDVCWHYVKFPAVLEGYCDANWISGNDEISSISGYVFTMCGGAISWKSAKQTCIARSTMESEFIALKLAGQEANWLRNLLTDVRVWGKQETHVSL
ncbi:transmembrane signal receptor [Lithospermum erythrorhizon]|uniref:Transmembrane signal receptor n=1 Tax=Lithospermum erythrorhizon TaxID=34254 RepID=A0AAV3PHP1_LITER